MLSKITRLNIIVISVMVALNIVVATFFVIVRPMKKEIEGLNSQIETYTARAAQRTQVAKKLAEAVALKAVTQTTWNKIKSRVMPTNLEVKSADRDTMIRIMPTYWREPERLTSIMTKWIGSQKGVRISGSFTLNHPGVDPLGLPKGTWNANGGQFTATGDFQTVLHHLERWNKSPRLVMINEVSLAGTSPNLVATYTAQLYQTIDGPRPVGGASPAAATPGAVPGATPGAGPATLTTPGAGNFGAPGTTMMPRPPAQ
ncbi:MAG: hypothetical protein ACYC1M_18080 [Armatimonadota bacterium]